MKHTDIPKKHPIPFANAGDKNTIPQTGGAAGAATLTDGFPPETMVPVIAGGIPPDGKDMNGVLFELSDMGRWANAGAEYTFDQGFCTAIGGYPAGARLLSSDGKSVFISEVDDNTANPEAVSDKWVGFSNYRGAITATTGVHTLTALDASRDLIVVSGTLTGNVQLVFPAWVKHWQIINSTTGNFSLTCKTASGSGVIVKSGFLTDIYGDGTSISSHANTDVAGVVRTVNDHGPDASGDVELPMFGLGLGPVAKTDAYSNIAQFYRVNNTSANKPPAVTGNVSAGILCLPMDAAPSAGYLAVVGGNMAAYVGFSGAEAGGITWARIYTEKYLPPMYGLGPAGSDRALLADLLSPNKGYTGYTWSATSGDPDAPTFFPQGGTFGIQNQLWHNTGQYFALQTVWRNGRIGFRTMEANAPGAWNEFFHTGHLPTATQTGALPLTGGTMTNEIKSTSGNILRGIQGGYGSIWRMDANASYLLLTNKDDPNGNFNSLRPLTINNSTGAVSIGTSLSVDSQNSIYKTGIHDYSDGGGSYHQTNGITLQGVGDQVGEMYFLENIGKYALVGLHARSGGRDAWYEFRHDGNIFANGTNVAPVGVIEAWPSDTPPTGWLMCDGSGFNKSIFPNLALIFPSGQLPDLRGAFLRGKDSGKGVDPNRDLLSIQPGQAPASAVGRGDWANYAGRDTGHAVSVGTDADHNYNVKQETEQQRETRPYNVAINYIVRAA